MEAAATLERILKAARLALRRLEQLELVALRVECLLHEFVLYVLLVSERQARADKLCELRVRV